jgi:trans-aconitate methyltransferase
MVTSRGREDRGAAEAWDSSQAYEQYVGRWSRKVAGEFLRWLAADPGLQWADVGCGTGALSATILDACQPSAVHGIDASDEFVARARQSIRDARARFEPGIRAVIRRGDPWASGI